MERRWQQAQSVGRYWMDRQARLHHFEIHRPVAVWLDRERNVYQYIVRSSRDIQDWRGGALPVFFLTPIPACSSCCFCLPDNIMAIL
jgi:hypothetical protein